MLRVSKPGWDTGEEFAVLGLVDLSAVPEGKSHLPLGDDDNPILLVEFTVASVRPGARPVGSQRSKHSGSNRSGSKRQKRKRRRCARAECSGHRPARLIRGGCLEEIIPNVHLVPGMKGANVYLLLGDLLTLVDTGMPGSEETILSQEYLLLMRKIRNA